MKLHNLVKKLEERLPLAWQENWDHCGLNLGSPSQDIKSVLFAYDICHEVVRAAAQKKCNLVISHHPFRMRAEVSLNLDSYEGRTIALAIKNNIALYSCHTNHDASSKSLNFYYLKKLQLKNIEPLATSSLALIKLIVFVPLKATEKVMKAIFAAGAGGIGNYDECSFQTQGTGTFRGNTKSNPRFGQKGRRESIEENRFETIVAEDKLNLVIAAMKAAHPYEEVAYDLIPLRNKRNDIGLGAIGESPKMISKKDFMAKLKKIFQIKNIRFVSSQKNSFKKIAICTGSGSGLIPLALKKDADVFITGDVKYHQAIEAKRAGLAIADVGHFSSEKDSIVLLKNLFEETFPNGPQTQIYHGLQDAFEFL